MNRDRVPRSEPFGDNERAIFRERFDEDAETYDRTRPVASEAVFDDLMRLCQLSEGSDLLEVGAGTGQATRPLLERGVHVTAIELGSSLAEIARRNLAGFRHVIVLNTAFEDPSPRLGDFDAVLACNSFHWLDPVIRFTKAAAMLRSGGYLALLSTPVVVPENAHRFWWDVQDDWEAVGARREDPSSRRAELFPDHAELVRGSGLFEEPTVVRRAFDVVMSAEEYAANLSTQSGLKALRPQAQQEMVDRVRHRVDWLGGHLIVQHAAVLTVARIAVR